MVARRILAAAGRALARAGSPPRRRRPPEPSRRRAQPPVSTTAYQGDFVGTATISYSPHADGLADPGEIVWAWVPYEDDPSQGKDRPVLVIAMDGADLLGLMLTSKDHRAGADRYGQTWFDLGSGPWDSQGRPSDVRLDRVLRLAPTAVRREGAALDRARFDRVAAEATRVLGW